MKKYFTDLVQAGGYHFGDLSALFCGLTTQERQLWDQEIEGFYPSDIRHEIARTIEAALFHKDENGQEDPVPIRFDWPAQMPHGLTQGIKITYNPVGPHYHIEIFGYPSPAGSALAKRRTRQDLTADDDIEA